MNCERTGCPNEATSYVGIEFYPPLALQRYYKTTQRLTRMIVGLKICATCLPNLKPTDILREQDIRKLGGAVSRGSQTAIDFDLTKVVAVAFDDPEVKHLHPIGAQGGGAQQS